MSEQNKVTSKRMPVIVDTQTHGRMLAYSEATGVTITHAAAEAINDWLDTVGAARLNAFKRTTLSNVLVMPERV